MRALTHTLNLFDKVELFDMVAIHNPDGTVQGKKYLDLFIAGLHHNCLDNG